MNRIYALIILALFLSCSPNNREQQNVHSKSEPQNQFKEAACFVYHRFGDSRFPSTNIPLDDFERHLQYLKDNPRQAGRQVEHWHWAQ